MGRRRMSDPLAPHDGSTPLTDEEREGFKLSYITTRGELNAAEQQTSSRPRSGRSNARTMS